MEGLTVALEHSADHHARNTAAFQDEHGVQHHHPTIAIAPATMWSCCPCAQPRGLRWASASISTDVPRGSSATPLMDLAGPESPKP